MLGVESCWPSEVQNMTRKPQSTHPVLGVIVSLALLGAAAPSQAQKAEPAPGVDRSRAAVSDALAKGDLAAATLLLGRLERSRPDASGAATESAAAAIPASGSITFEQIRACGFYPQETRLECALDIKQTSGYGGNVASLGSFEFVYFCVDWNCDGQFSAGEATGMGIVHMHDESGGAGPTWQYAVYRDIDPPGQPSPQCRVRTGPGGPGAITQTNGPTHAARAILSWATPPTSCSYSPVWGNVVDFRIRFDPNR
jgi:hypothetical protein